MARIKGVPPAQAGPYVKISYYFTRRGIGMLTGRETEVLDRAAWEVSPVPGQPQVTASPGAGPAPGPGVLAVPLWRAGLDASVLPRDYRDLLEVAGDAGRPQRAAQIAAAAGLSTDRGKVETLRAKLKRLAERGWLTEETGPGLFGLPAHAGNGAGEAAKPG